MERAELLKREIEAPASLAGGTSGTFLSRAAARCFLGNWSGTLRKRWFPAARLLGLGESHCANLLTCPGGPRPISVGNALIVKTRILGNHFSQGTGFCRCLVRYIAFPSNPFHFTGVTGTPAAHRPTSDYAFQVFNQLVEL